MYFAILGKNQEISLAELALVHPQNIERINDQLIHFDSEYENLLPQLGGITKWGRVVNETELLPFFEGKRILWVENKKLWLKFKKQGFIRRFKIIEQQKTDLDIKNKGIEVLKFSHGYGVVLWYQNIPLYEAVDFQKPSRSMQMGMMPAKFTHILVNIGIISNHQDLQTNIYDPFAWSGTTGMISNFLWYNFIGSDINIQHLSQNVPRWKTTKFYKKDKTLDFFEQDILQDIDPQQLDFNTVIVTEGRLWPIINKHADTDNIQDAEAEVIQLYKSFIQTASKLKKSGKLKAIVTTIPHYFRYENHTGQELFAYAQKLGRECNYIDEIYARPRQRVGRKILIFT